MAKSKARGAYSGGAYEKKSVYITYVHVAALIGVFYIPVLKWQTLILLLLTFSWSTLGITAGAHRLWSHRSFKAHWTVRLFLMICSCFSNQGSVYHWARDHRVHHKFSETHGDPHNVSISLVCVCYFSSDGRREE